MVLLPIVVDGSNEDGRINHITAAAATSKTVFVCRNIPKKKTAVACRGLPRGDRNRGLLFVDDEDEEDIGDLTGVE